LDVLIRFAKGFLMVTHPLFSGIFSVSLKLFLFNLGILISICSSKIIKIGEIWKEIPFAGHID